MIFPDALGNIINSIPSNIFATNNLSKIGQVIGVVTGENLPTPTQYLRANKVIGSVIYAEVNTDGPIKITDSFDDKVYNNYNIAKPFLSSTIDYPLKGELIWIKEDFPSANAGIEGKAINTYYIGIINVWGSPQHNSVADYSLGISFVENSNIRSLLSFEGDRIIQGRQGSALRFSSTTKLYNDLNEWSSIGNDDNPITILSNGFSYDPNKNFYVEKINSDLSSIYLTSTQQLPLQTDKTGILNNLTNPISVSNYFNAQVIINSDRVVLNSKRDEVMIFAKSNIELNTKNIINLNADERVHLNSKEIFLGTVNNQLPTEPLVLGDKLNTLLENLLDSLYNFGTSLSTVVGSPEGAPALDITSAAGSLLNDIDRINNNLEGILSQRNFTS